MLIWAKKSPHFREKYFVLSYLKDRSRTWRKFQTCENGRSDQTQHLVFLRVISAALTSSGRKKSKVTKLMFTVRLVCPVFRRMVHWWTRGEYRATRASPGTCRSAVHPFWTRPCMRRPSDVSCKRCCNVGDSCSLDLVSVLVTCMLRWSREK